VGSGGKRAKTKGEEKKGAPKKLRKGAFEEKRGSMPTQVKPEKGNSRKQRHTEGRNDVKNDRGEELNWERVMKKTFVRKGPERWGKKMESQRAKGRSDRKCVPKKGGPPSSRANRKKQR